MADSRIASFRVVDPETERVLFVGFRLAENADVRFYKRQLAALGFQKVTFISWFDELFPEAQLDIVDWDVGEGDPVLCMGQRVTA